MSEVTITNWSFLLVCHILVKMILELRSADELQPSGDKLEVISSSIVHYIFNFDFNCEGKTSNGLIINFVANFQFRKRCIAVQ